MVSDVILILHRVVFVILCHHHRGRDEILCHHHRGRDEIPQHVSQHLYHEIATSTVPCASQGRHVNVSTGTESHGYEKTISLALQRPEKHGLGASGPTTMPSGDGAATWNLGPTAGVRHNDRQAEPLCIHIFELLTGAMEHLKHAAEHTKVVVKLPTKWVNTYANFITKNAGAVGQVEGALRSLTYLVPGRLSHADITSEFLNAGVQVLALYHDNLLSRALAQSLRPQPRHQSPHNRYTGFYCQKSPTYRRAATTLQIVQYTELLLEMMAKRKGEKVRWRVVMVLESIKAACRLILLRLTNSRPLLTPPLPERQLLEDKPAQDREESLSGPPSEPSVAGSEQWTMPRTCLTLPPLPDSSDISSYLLSKVLTADDIKPPKALVHRTCGLGEVAEVMFILRPVIYAAAMAYWSQRENGKGKADWRPWLLGIGIEYGARQLAKHELETRRPGGARGLTQLEREEIKKRGWSLAWWSMRGAFYQCLTRGLIRGFAAKLKGKPLLDMVGNFVDDYEFLWDQYYFPTATL